MVNKASKKSSKASSKGPRRRARAQARPDRASERVAAELVEPETGLAVQRNDLSAEQTHEEVKELLQMFMDQRSELTRRNYLVDLEHFTRWLMAKSKCVPFGEVSTRVPRSAIEMALVALFRMRGPHAAATVSSYLVDLHGDVLGQKYSVQTINHRLSVLKMLSKTAKGLGISTIDLSIVKGKKPKLSRSTEGCGEDGLERILACAQRRIELAQSPYAKTMASRNALIVLLLHDAAFRRFEALSCRVPEHVDLKEGRMFFRRKKRDEAQWYDVSDSIIAALELYLEHRGRQKGFLFPGSTRGRGRGGAEKPIDRGTINAILGSIAKEAEVPVTPHGLRHTAATTLLEETGGNVRAVAEFLGHSDLRTVQQYDDDRKKLAKQMGNLLGERRKKA